MSNIVLDEIIERYLMECKFSLKTLGIGGSCQNRVYYLVLLGCSFKIKLVHFCGLATKICSWWSHSFFLRIFALSPKL
jgi:hypothetical protein